MTKESSSSQAPKAVNIIRPNTNYGNLLQHTTSTTSNSSGGSVNSYNSLPAVMQHQQKRNNSIHSTNSSLISSSATSGVRKPRVMSVSHASEKPVLNIYHPPNKKVVSTFYIDEYTNGSNSRGSSVVSSSTNGNSNKPAIEIYKPNQTRLTKSFTAPSLVTTEQQPINKPISRSTHRSVLGPINTPVAAATVNNSTLHHPTATPNIISPIIEKTQAQLENTIENHLLVDKSTTTTTTSESELEDVEEEEEELSEKGLGSGIQDSPAEDDEIEEEEEEPVINEARVNRKVSHCRNHSFFFSQNVQHLI